MIWDKIGFNSFLAIILPKWESPAILSNERHRNQEPEEGKLPQQDQDRTLESAIAEFGGGLSPDGTGDGDEDQPDYAECFRSIEDKAGGLGVLYDRWQPAVEGGREHDLTYDELSGTYDLFLHLAILEKQQIGQGADAATIRERHL